MLLNVALQGSIVAHTCVCEHIYVASSCVCVGNMSIYMLLARNRYAYVLTTDIYVAVRNRPYAF